MWSWRWYLIATLSHGAKGEKFSEEQWWCPVSHGFISQQEFFCSFLRDGYQYLKSLKIGPTPKVSKVDHVESKNDLVFHLKSVFSKLKMVGDNRCTLCDFKVFPWLHETRYQENRTNKPNGSPRALCPPNLVVLRSAVLEEFNLIEKALA